MARATVGGNISGERLASLETLLKATLEQLPSNIKLAVQDGIKEVIEPLSARIATLEKIAAGVTASNQTAHRLSDQVHEWARALLPYALLGASLYFGASHH
jgi:hypothetical protein